MKIFVAVALGLALTNPLFAQSKPRARDLGIPFEGTPGVLNAITDVAGVEVGMSTLITGEAVRTGVTAILPRGKNSSDPAFAGWFSLTATESGLENSILPASPLAF
jgi:D-aminopeptidase